MKLICVSDDGLYPDQHASAIRQSTILKGIVEEGHDVLFFILSPQNWSRTEIDYNGIKFISLAINDGGNKIIKKINFYQTLTILEEKILEVISHSENVSIIIYSVNPYVISRVLRVSKKFNLKVFHERTELPNVIGHIKSPLGKLKYAWYKYSLVPRFTGIFVISDKLIDFFSKLNPNTHKILTVVDTNFFKNKWEQIKKSNYIGYCGTMHGSKDGMSVLVESFSKLSKEFSDLKLLLIGDNSHSKSTNKLFRLIDSLGLKEKIEFTGYVERKEMPFLLCNAIMLVVAKPDTEQNSGNFPIKIGEYLSTGVPIVVTKVGEIEKFIIDGENGFLADPDSIDSFYMKMKELLMDYDRSLLIGKNGKKLADNLFDYRVQSRKMLDYIKST